MLEHHPGAHLLEAAAAHILRRLDHFGPADTSNSIWAYARLFTSPGTELLQVPPHHSPPPRSLHVPRCAACHPSAPHYRDGS